MTVRRAPPELPPGRGAVWRRRGLAVAAVLITLWLLGPVTGIGGDRERSHGAPPAGTAGLTTTTTTGGPATFPVRTAPVDGAAERYPVDAVTDGDTLVLVDGRRIRLAQVDAPEAGGDCFGGEATAHLRRLVSGGEVELRRPASAPVLDRFGRTVAEVLVPEGAVPSVNEALIRGGSAQFDERFAAEDPELAVRLAAAEADARSAGRGLWSACGTPREAPASLAEAAPANVAPARCHPAYTPCVPPAPPDLDCAAIGTRVRVDHPLGDPHGLDGTDRDGWGCESHG